MYLVGGEMILAEPAAIRLATALAERAGGRPEVRRRPSDLRPLLADLRTFSLFGGGKVVVAVDSAVLADREGAVELVAEALAAAPAAGEGELSAVQREAASRLLQALHLFGVDSGAGDGAAALAQLPDWSLAGKAGARVGRRQAEERRQSLAPLLAAARREGLQGVGEEGVGLLADVLRRGLPEGHFLVLVERSVAAGHPVVELLRSRGAVAELGRLAAERGGWAGIGDLARQLEAETGIAIRRDALDELARRTLRQEEGRGAQGATADSAGRFAAEYRKLAELAGGETIGRALVEDSVVDRGEEDVWQLLDTLAEGRGDEAQARVARLVGGSDDPLRARLSFFSLLAGFCRQLVAVRGVVDRLGLARGERSYNRFKERLAPVLTADLPEGWASPVAGVHPFRLHRAYLAACRMPAPFLARLPWRLLEAELALKGESGEPDAALAVLVGEVAAAARG
ncbi:MAG TPA: hypothetical protein VMT16_01775 [Thermoanaerobaculia bacterium]|nr:hypothetical protein [Thermoanaerobaculia bacterium]